METAKLHWNFLTQFGNELVAQSDEGTYRVKQLDCGAWSSKFEPRKSSFFKNDDSLYDAIRKCECHFQGESPA
jgi:hypothetical protein